jgi:hypothetical protein
MKTSYFSLLWLVSIFRCAQILILCPIVFFFTNSMAAGATVSVNNDLKSVLIVTDTNAIQLQPWSAGTIRVEAAPGKTIPDKKGIENVAVIATPDATAWVVTDDSDKVDNVHATVLICAGALTGLLGFDVEDISLSNICFESQEGAKVEWVERSIPEYPKASSQTF